jgi:hypothetical protein
MLCVPLKDLQTATRPHGVTFQKAVPWLKQLMASFSPQRSGSNPWLVPVGFVVDKLALLSVF